MRGITVVIMLIVLIAPAHAQPRVYDFTRVTDAMNYAVRDIPLQGAALLVMQDGVVIYEGGFGAFSVDTDLPIASGSKWLSAAVLMSVVDDGAVSLDDPISYYLPEFRDSAITVRQLLSHTSGLIGMHACTRDTGITMSLCVNQIAGYEPIATPGAEFFYGGAAFQVSGRIAEVASGQSWMTLFEERLAAPLNMTHTTFGETQNPSLGGGARSTARDYANFLQMLLDNGKFNGQQLLSAESVLQMRLDHTAQTRVAYTPHPDPSTHYGLGNWLNVTDSDGIGVVVSSPGAYGFVPWIDYERGVVAVFAAYHTWAGVHPTIIAVQERLQQVLDQ